VQKDYIFNGWYSNPEFHGEAIMSIKSGSVGDTILYANFSSLLNEVEIEVEKNEIYPNPSKGLLIVVGQDISAIDIFNLEGRIIYHQDNISSNFQVDIRYLPKGLYIVKLLCDNKTVTKKLMLE
jgi:uncharacterized repeat protein (TIGR02543 family)